MSRPGLREAKHHNLQVELAVHEYQQHIRDPGDSKSWESPDEADIF